jgi:uncharacterized protein
MAVVSNSSPLIFYAKIGRLDILRNLFNTLLIPPAVYAEVAIAGAGRIGAAEIQDEAWIQRRALAQPERSQTFTTRVDQGEAEAIALALELEHEVILLDDGSGRRLAREQGLRPIGCAGILVLAREQGLIHELVPLLDDLRAAGLYLSDGAYQVVRRQAGE